MGIKFSKRSSKRIPEFDDETYKLYKLVEALPNSNKKDRLVIAEGILNLCKNNTELLKNFEIDSRKNEPAIPTEFVIQLLNYCNDQTISNIENLAKVIIPYEFEKKGEKKIRNVEKGERYSVDEQKLKDMYKKLGLTWTSDSEFPRRNRGFPQKKRNSFSKRRFSKKKKRKNKKKSLVKKRSFNKKKSPRKKRSLKKQSSIEDIINQF